MVPSKSFCQIPWIHRFTNEQGFHMLCCVGTGDANMLHDASGKILHISQTLTDAEHLNSPDMKQIRVGMLQGAWPKACERCRQVEEAGAQSNRHRFNERYAHWIDESIDQTLANGTLARPAVRYADIRLGNVCNLTCRMCGPGASRLWADHFNKVQPVRYRATPSELKSARENNWVKSQPVEWLTRQCLPTVEGFNFGGGEPLMIPEMAEVLQYCVDSGRAGEIDLAYNTNITVLPDNVTRLWAKFRSVSLVCSIDGFGAVNDYIRRPSKWRDIDRNLRRIDENKAEWNLKSIVVSTTLQAYNVMQIGELVDYVSQNFGNVDPIPQLVPLYGPRYLSIQALPPVVKDVARTRLMEARAKVLALGRADLDWLSCTYDSCIAYLDEGRSTHMDLVNFKFFSEKSDMEFGDSWRAACPELSQLLP